MNKTDKSNRPFVFVRCLTYNHEKYIEDALKGFAMQKTDFPFVVTIVNDASPDKTADVIKSFITENCSPNNISYMQTAYADIIYARPIANSNCLLYVLNLYENHFQKKSHRPYYKQFTDKATYWAECEGDDYWTDPLKLQKQVDFLEAHPEYGCCCHRFVEYYEDTKSFSKTDHWAGVITDDMVGLKVDKENYFQIGRLPQVLTTIYRRNVFESSKYNVIASRSQYDQTMFYALVQEAPIWIMNEQMGVYRRHSGGIATSIKGTIEAQRKQYLTWKDTYEVYQTDETRIMYESNLKAYLYRYIKMAKPLDKKELSELVDECKDLYGGHLPMKLRLRMAKAYILRVIKRI